MSIDVPEIRDAVAETPEEHWFDLLGFKYTMHMNETHCSDAVVHCKKNDTGVTLVVSRILANYKSPSIKKAYHPPPFSITEGASVTSMYSAHGTLGGSHLHKMTTFLLLYLIVLTHLIIVGVNS